MLEFALVALYLAALLGAVAYAFLRPHGVYWRSALGVGAVIVLASAIWLFASPVISNEAGLGAFVIWCAIVVLAALVAAAACIAAALRHILNMFAARRA